MELIETKNWIYIQNPSSTQNRKSIKGKYLFFSDNKQELIDLAKNLLSELDLIKGKVPQRNNTRTSKGFAFVLCVYDSKNRYSNFLKTLETKTISYRYWKSDEATRNGAYSKQYLKSKQ
jgi:hypothetical protein